MARLQYNRHATEPSTAGPLVSIVMAVYNGENFLRAAVESALAQTYPHLN